MAHRVIIQVALTGARVFGRAFAEAYKQASAAQQFAKNNPGGAGASSSATSSSSGLTLDEACKILNVPPPKGGATDMESMLERFKKLFDTNDPNKGGSFYLQSKILRARERIEAEVKEAQARTEADKAREEGWNPKVYKDK